MDNKKLYITVIIVLLLINAVTVTLLWIKFFTAPDFKREERHHIKGKPGIRLDSEFISEALNFSPEQQKTYEEIEKRHFDYARPLFDSIFVWKKYLLDRSIDGGLSPEEVAAVTNKIGNTQALLEKDLYQHFSEIKNICSNEQKEKFKDLVLKEAVKKGPKPPRPQER